MAKSLFAERGVKSYSTFLRYAKNLRQNHNWRPRGMEFADIKDALKAHQARAERQAAKKIAAKQEREEMDFDTALRLRKARAAAREERKARKAPVAPARPRSPEPRQENVPPPRDRSPEPVARQSSRLATRHLKPKEQQRRSALDELKAARAAQAKGLPFERSRTRGPSPPPETPESRARAERFAKESKRMAKWTPAEREQQKSLKLMEKLASKIEKGDLPLAQQEKLLAEYVALEKRARKLGLHTLPPRPRTTETRGGRT